jgi:O-antigen ligase
VKIIPEKYKYLFFKISWVILLLSVICDYSIGTHVHWELIQKITIPKPSAGPAMYVIIFFMLVDWKTIVSVFKNRGDRITIILLTLLLGSIYLSALFSEHRDTALQSAIFRFTIFYLCFICTLIYTYRFKNSTNFVLKSIIYINILVVVSSIIDYYIPSFNALLVERFGHLEPKHSVLKLAGEKYMRPSGLVTDTNLTAFSIILSCLSLLLNDDKFKSRIFKYSFYALSGYSFGMLASRSALIAMVFSVAVFFFTKKIERKRIYIFLIIFFVVQLMTPQTLSRIRQVFEKQYIEEDITVGRLVLWKAAFKAFESSPVIGIGTGVFFLKSIDYLRDVWDASSHGDFNSYERYRVNPHNVFLSMLAEEGIIGFTIFVVLIIYYLRLLVQQKKYIALTVMIALLIVSSLSNYAPYYKYYMVLCIALYICAKQDMKIESRKDEKA